MNKNRNFISSAFQYFIIVFLLTGTVIYSAISLFYNIRTQEYLELVSLQEEFSVMLQEQIIMDSLNEIISDIIILSSQNELHAFLEDYGDMTIEDIEQEFVNVSKTKEFYDQIRYIDAEGFERVRVNYDAQGVETVAKEDLQYKGDRYYFRDSINLPQGDIFISPFDLNIEQGKLEEPHKPMIRFSTPVYDNAGSCRGVVVLNYLGEHLLDRLVAASQTSFGETILLNREGYCLTSPFEEHNWAFMFEDKIDHKIFKRFPFLVNEFQRRDTGQINNEHGMFTFSSVYPVRDDLHTSDGTHVPDGTSSGTYDSSQYYWTVISYVSPGRIRSLSQTLLTRIMTLSSVLFFLSACTSAVIAYFLSKRKLYNLSILENARYDRLTQLYNRNYFLESLESAIDYSHRYNEKMALCFIELDEFKPINDNYGHETGDHVLQVIADRLKENTRKSDIVGRYGGDEFLVCLRNIENQHDVEMIVQKLIEIVPKDIMVKNAILSCGCSIGICFFPDQADTADDLIKYADIAMYNAKMAGKNRFEFYQ